MNNPSPGSPAGSAPPRSPVKPSGLPPLNYELFRQQLANLIDPDRKPGLAEKQSVKETAERLCSIFAKLFSDDFDRKTLWGRIGTAFETAVAKVSDDDLDRLIDLCLEHINADLAQAAACDALTQVRQQMDSWPPETRHSFLGYLRAHKYALLTHGRARWERKLGEAKARKASGGSGEVEL